MAQLKNDEWPAEGEPTTTENQMPGPAGKPPVRGGSDEHPPENETTTVPLDNITPDAHTG